MFVVTAQSHVFLKGSHYAVNSGFPKTPALGLGKHILMKTFTSNNLRCQYKGLFSSVAVPNLSRN